MGMLEEISEIARDAEDYRSLKAHVLEVIERPRIKILSIDPDEVDAEWIERTFTKLLENYADQQKQKR